MGTAAQRATPRGRRLAALVVAALAVTVTACGEDEPMANIPQEDASTMVDLLDQASAAAEAGDCAGAQAAVDQYVELVNLLRAEDVETEVKESMRNAGFRLEELINDQCGDSAAATEPAVTEEPTEEEPTEEEPAEEQPTEEQPTEEEPTETETETEEEPPEQPPGEGEVTPPPDEDEDDGENSGPGGGEDTGDDSGTGAIEG
jgi:hypothetical protein